MPVRVRTDKFTKFFHIWAKQSKSISRALKGADLAVIASKFQLLIFQLSSSDCPLNIMIENWLKVLTETFFNERIASIWSSDLFCPEVMLRMEMEWAQNMGIIWFCQNVSKYLEMFSYNLQTSWPLLYWITSGMGAKCSHTLSKWAVWHYPPFNTPNGR